nr:unnamed protein product [Callosobruchus chinensis]
MLCNFQTKWESHLKRHSLAHSDTRNYKCTYCDHSSKDKFSLRRHLVTHKPPSELEMHRCPECKFETKWKHIMKDHMLLHVELSDFEVIICPLCKVCFKQISDLKKHLLVHQENNTTEIYQCYFCYYRSIRKNCVNRHIMTRHRELCITVKSEEDQLDETNIDAPKEGEKKETEQPEKEDTNPIKRLKCAYCEFRTNWRSYLRRHELVHNKTREHRCPECDQTTKDKYSLKRHILLMHQVASEITMHSCQYCSYITKWKHVLKNHQLVHADVMGLTLFRCPVCDYGFKRKSDMVRHR